MVIERVMHPAYEIRSRYNDIGLLKLGENVQFNDFVRPACLCTDRNYHWDTALAIGFGKLSYGECGIGDQ